MSVHAPREPERRDELHEFTSSLTPDTLKRELQPSSLEFNLQVVFLRLWANQVHSPILDLRLSTHRAGGRRIGELETGGTGSPSDQNLDRESGKSFTLRAKRDD